MHEVLRVGRLWDGREPQELSGAQAVTCVPRSCRTASSTGAKPLTCGFPRLEGRPGGHHDAAMFVLEVICELPHKNLQCQPSSNGPTTVGVSTAPYLEALKSEDVTGDFIMCELRRFRGDAPRSREASLEAATASCSAPVRQLAAILHQLGVRARDMDLWGDEWISAAEENTFSERGHKLAPQDLREVADLVSDNSSHSAHIVGYLTSLGYLDRQAPPSPRPGFTNQEWAIVLLEDVAADF